MMIQEIEQYALDKFISDRQQFGEKRYEVKTESVLFEQKETIREASEIFKSLQVTGNNFFINSLEKQILKLSNPGEVYFFKHEILETQDQISRIEFIINIKLQPFDKILYWSTYQIKQFENLNKNQIKFSFAKILQNIYCRPAFKQSNNKENNQNILNLKILQDCLISQVIKSNNHRTIFINSKQLKQNYQNTQEGELNLRFKKYKTELNKNYILKEVWRINLEFIQISSSRLLVEYFILRIINQFQVFSALNVLCWQIALDVNVYQVNTQFGQWQMIFCTIKYMCLLFRFFHLEYISF